MVSLSLHVRETQNSKELHHLELNSFWFAKEVFSKHGLVDLQSEPLHVPVSQLPCMPSLN
jgi:hypothetical protein